MPQNKQFYPLDKWGVCKSGDFPNHNITSRRGSILLYTLLLTSFLVLFFVSFQGEIEKKLGQTQNFGEMIQDISHAKDTLVLLKNNPQANQVISSNENISLVSLTQSGNIFSGLLEGTQSHEYWITQTGGAISLAFDILEGGPLFYHLSTFNSGSESSALLVSSGAIANHASIGLSGVGAQYIFVVEGLGGHTKYTLDASTTTIIPQNNFYKKARDINGYSKTAGIYEVVNFIPKTRTNFPYESMGMYLKK